MMNTMIDVRIFLMILLTLSSSFQFQLDAASTVVEAWCVIFQVKQKVRESAELNELNLIHYEDTTLSIAVSTLYRESETMPEEKRKDLQLSLQFLGRSIAELHSAADAGDRAKVLSLLPSVLESFEKAESFYNIDVLAPARALADRYTCPMHTDAIGKKGDECPKCGMLLDQLVRPAPFRPGAVLSPVKTIRARIGIDSQLRPGKRVTARLRLSTMSDEQPVTPADLREVHTQKIHLFIVDQSLSDYHHEHPTPTTTPGEYMFSFIPQKPGSYRAWADLRPLVSGFQEYALADIPSDQPGEALQDKSEKLKAETDGFHFELNFKNSVVAGIPVDATLRVLDPRGQPFRKLEPVMNAYAHLAGFYEDAKTIFHIHPRGLPIIKSDSYGGPELKFTFYAPQPGFIRLFSQVQIRGEQKFAPFGIHVLPASPNAITSSAKIKQ